MKFLLALCLLTRAHGAAQEPTETQTSVCVSARHALCRMSRCCASGPLASLRVQMDHGAGRDVPENMASS